MYEFTDRLVSVALPRVRDFKGLSQSVRRPWQLYTRLKEQLIFRKSSTIK